MFDEASIHLGERRILSSFRLLVDIENVWHLERVETMLSCDNSERFVSSNVVLIAGNQDPGLARVDLEVFHRWPRSATSCQTLSRLGEVGDGRSKWTRWSCSSTFLFEGAEVFGRSDEILELEWTMDVRFKSARHVGSRLSGHLT